MSTLGTGGATALAETIPPRYDLDASEMAQRESEMVDMVKEAHGETVAALWLPSDSPYAEVIRTHEVGHFPEIAEIMKPYETESEFLTLVDTRANEDRVVHGFRISSPALTEISTGNEVNIAFVQDLLASGQFSKEAFVRYYKGSGIDLKKCVSVETNFRVGKRVEGVFGAPTAQLGYLSLFHAVSKGVNAGEGAVFAHLNQPATLSLGQVGVEYEPIMGNPDIKTPTINGQYDTKYRPVAIPINEHNIALFTNLGAIAPPSIDLR
jgi:hypothetical protein